MGKYSRLTRQASLPKRPWVIHPIWQGFGCILLVVGPFMAFAGAHLLVETDMQRGWVGVPPEMTRTITVPGTINIFMWSFRIGNDLAIPHFYADLVVAILLVMLIFALVMIIYSIIYSFLGPRRYGPLDSPPIRRSQIRRRK
jgi:small neutral amino acid transporter SnatA (MarC family)